MKRLNTPTALAAFAGVIALLVIGYQSDNASTDRYATLVKALDVAYNDIDQLREERIIELPEDGGAWWTTLIMPSGDAAADPVSRRVETMFATNTRLQSLLTQTRVNRYYPGHPMYDAKYRPIYGSGQTAIVIQTPDGKVCYKATGENIPTDANVLADAIDKAIRDCRPRPNPEPTPTPQPVPDLTPTIPDTVTPDGLANQENLAGALIALGIAGLVGAGLQWRREGQI